MNKKLIIIVYKIVVGCLTAQQGKEQLSHLMQTYCFEKDEELKENYYIREIWLPIKEGNSDVKVIYPINSNSPDLINLAEEVSKRIKESPDDVLKISWKKLLRELKLIELQNKI